MTSNQPWSMCSAPLEISSNVLADEDGEVGGGGRGAVVGGWGGGVETSCSW